MVTQPRRGWRYKARKRSEEASRDLQERILAEKSNTCKHQFGESSPKMARGHTMGETRLQGCIIIMERVEDTRILPSRAENKGSRPCRT